MFEDRVETIKKINELQIPKRMLAAVTGLDHRRIADFVKCQALPDESAARIKNAVSRVVFIWDVFNPYRIPITSPELLRSAFEDALTTERNRKMADAELQLENATLSLQRLLSEVACSP